MRATLYNAMKLEKMTEFFTKHNRGKHEIAAYQKQNNCIGLFPALFSPDVL